MKFTNTVTCARAGGCSHAFRGRQVRWPGPVGAGPDTATAQRENLRDSCGASSVHRVIGSASRCMKCKIPQRTHHMRA